MILTRDTDDVEGHTFVKQRRLKMNSSRSDGQDKRAPEWVNVFALFWCPISLAHNTIYTSKNILSEHL